MGKYKFIKDGAYSIKVEETENTQTNIEKEKKYDSDGDEIEDDDYENDILFQNIEEQPVELEEYIDYTDTNFILQNLKLALPDVTEDKTLLLTSREQQAKIICSQVRFYLYCCLTAFMKDPKIVSILIVGEGYIGTHIINELIDAGCKDMLKIYSRGDITSAEWQLKGLKASNNMKTLLNGIQPDVIIITVENLSFNILCKQLLTNSLINEATFIISCSFGFQRTKLCTSLNTMSIFRTYTEPQEVVNRYKQESLNKIASMIDPNGISSKILKSLGTPMKTVSFKGSSFLGHNRTLKNTSIDMRTADNSRDNSKPSSSSGGMRASVNTTTTASVNSRPTTSEQIISSAIEAANASYHASLAQEGDSYFLNSKDFNLDQAFLPPLDITLTTEVDNMFAIVDNDDIEGLAAECVGKRLIHIKHLIYQLENFYTIVRKYEPEEARYKALFNVLGVAKEDFLQEEEDDESSIAAATSLRSKSTNNDRNLEEELQKIQQLELSYATLTLKRKLKAQLRIKNKIENVLTNLYNKGIVKYQQYLKLFISKNDLYQLIKQEFMKECETIPDKKHRKRPVTAPLYGKPMYKVEFLMDIFKYDEEYSHLIGTHSIYNLMAYYDGKIDHIINDDDDLFSIHKIDSKDSGDDCNNQNIKK